MTYQRIGASRYDLLIVRDLDRRGRVAVLSQHKKDEQESQRNHPVSDDRDIGWHRRPAEPVIEHGEHQERGEPEHHQSHDYLLRSFCFSPRSGTQAPLQKFFVVEGHIDGKSCRADREGGQECPTLPETQRPGGKKDEDGKHDKAAHAGFDRTGVEIFMELSYAAPSAFPGALDCHYHNALTMLSDIFLASP